MGGAERALLGCFFLPSGNLGGQSTLMSDPRKPTTEADLPVPFGRIGEDGWAERARAVLESYGVKLPVPVPPAEIASAESRLAVAFPETYRLLLSTLGPLDMDGIRFLPLSDVTRLDGYWARDHFTPSERAQLANHLAIVDYLGSDDFIGLNVQTGECARCGHDPPGFSSRLASVDALVQIAFMKLPAGYYGWDDPELEALVEGALRRRFGVRL